jgi:hypothetical protein
MRLIQLLVLAVSAFTTPQAAAPTPEPATPHAQAEPSTTDSSTVPILITPYGALPVPDNMCDRTEDGYFIFVGPDKDFAISNESCVLAVKQWFQQPDIRPLPKA